MCRVIWEQGEGKTFLATRKSIDRRTTKIPAANTRVRGQMTFGRLATVGRPFVRGRVPFDRRDPVTGDEPPSLFRLPGSGGGVSDRVVRETTTPLRNARIDFVFFDGVWGARVDEFRSKSRNGRRRKTPECSGFVAAYESHVVRRPLGRVKERRTVRHPSTNVR